MKNSCSNCALCSFVCSTNKIECDYDNHVINNEYNESCEENFIPLENEENN